MLRMDWHHLQVGRVISNGEPMKDGHTLGRVIAKEARWGLLGKIPFQFEKWLTYQIQEMALDRECIEEGSRGTALKCLRWSKKTSREASKQPWWVQNERSNYWTNLLSHFQTGMVEGEQGKSKNHKMQRYSMDEKAKEAIEWNVEKVKFLRASLVLSNRERPGDLAIYEEIPRSPVEVQPFNVKAWIQ